MEDLIWKLRNPPTMSMALNYNHLYKIMAERMAEAAEALEKMKEEK